VTRNKALGVEYLELLAAEIALTSNYFKNRSIAQLHLGGGTPTFLDDEQINRLFASLRDAFTFRDDQSGEFSIEIDPRTVDPERISALRSVGFNRLSFGIQDFNEKVQKAVNRKQSFEETQAAMNRAREEGFKSVSVDLIYGLPFQSRQTFTETLHLVNELRPDRISIYNYAHLPDRFPPQQRILATDLPNPDEKLEILDLCVDELTRRGYVSIGMDHFALPDDELTIAQQQGTLHRNFQGYSTMAELDMLALGVTAISHIGNTYSQNTRELDNYRAALTKGQLPIEKGVVIDRDDQLRGAVIRGLMCQFRIDYADFLSIHKVDFVDYFPDELNRLKTMQADGLLKLSPTGIEVTPRGRYLIRNVAMVFDRHLPGTTNNRFSRAI
tara:strand:- start:425 stop:1579 length:1155 start_codon:yes stop_codon:yes gene_type:complete